MVRRRSAPRACAAATTRFGSCSLVHDEASRGGGGRAPGRHSPPSREVAQRVVWHPTEEPWRACSPCSMVSRLKLFFQKAPTNTCVASRPALGTGGDTRQSKPSLTER